MIQKGSIEFGFNEPFFTLNLINMKYKNQHLEKPGVNQLIYWLGPDGKDHLGWFRGKYTYEEYERKFPGFLPKWWYAAEIGLVPDPKAESNSLKINKKPKKEKNM